MRWTAAIVLATSLPGVPLPAGEVNNHLPGFEPRVFGWDLVPVAERLVHSGFRTSYAIGDFDGDGAADLAIGTPFATIDGHYPAGKVTVVYGPRSPRPSTRVQTIAQSTDGDVEIPGSAGRDLVGYGLAAGDFDGDGLTDLAIGAPGTDIGNESDAGCVFVVTGSRGGLRSDRRPAAYCQAGDGGPGGRTSVGPGDAQSGALLGFALAVGNFDRDAFDDLAIGVPGWRPAIARGPHEAGMVIVVPGSGNGLAVSDRGGPFSPYLIGGAGFARSRSQLAGLPRGQAGLVGAALAVGDFNGDGADDLAIGAPGGTSGAVLVATGSPRGLDARPEAAPFSPSSDGRHRLPVPAGAVSETGIGLQPRWVGLALAAGDFDGDGLDDLAVGAPGERPQGVGGAGAVYLANGSRHGLVASDYPSPLHSGAEKGLHLGGAPEAGTLLGLALASGDFNGDGADDLAIGAPGWRQDMKGVVFIKLGSRSITVAGIRLPGGLRSQTRLLTRRLAPFLPSLPGKARAGDLVGLELAAGRLDGNRFADLVIAAPGARVTNANAGLMQLTDRDATRDMLLDGYTMVIPGGRRRGPSLAAGFALSDRLPIRTFRRFGPLLTSDPAGVRLRPEAVRQILTEHTAARRQRIDDVLPGRVLRYRTRNWRVARDSVSLTYDLKFDLCHGHSEPFACCIEFDAAMTTLFHCANGNDLLLYTFSSSSIRDADQCIAFFHSNQTLGDFQALVRQILPPADVAVLEEVALGDSSGLQVVCEQARVLPDQSLELALTLRPGGQ